MLFFVDSQTKELARIEIYDFKIIRKNISKTIYIPDNKRDH